MNLGKTNRCDGDHSHIHGINDIPVFDGGIAYSSENNKPHEETEWFNELQVESNPWHGEKSLFNSSRQPLVLPDPSFLANEIVENMEAGHNNGLCKMFSFIEL